MITDLNPELDRTSAGTYINGLKTELDKLYISLLRDQGVASQAKAEIVKQIKDYVAVTQIYPDKQPIPPRTVDDENV